MANYNDLKTAIQQVIRTNGNEEITGAILQQSLLSMINSLGAGYQFMGVATPSTNPGTPDQKVFYLANQVGEYSNFGFTLQNVEVAIFKWDGTWHKDSISITNYISGKRTVTTGLSDDANSVIPNILIPVIPGESLVITGTPSTNSALQYFDEDGEFIDYITVTANNDISFTTGSTTHFIRVSFDINKLPVAKIISLQRGIIWKPNDITINSKLSIENEKIYKNYTDNVKISSTGGYIIDSTCMAPDRLIPVLPSDTVKWDNNSASGYIVFYDSNKIKIDFWNATLYNSINAPNNSAYFIIGFKKDGVDKNVYVNNKLVWRPIDNIIFETIELENKFKRNIDAIKTSNYIEGKKLNTSGVEIDDATAFLMGDYLPVNAGADYTFVKGVGYACEFDDNKNLLDYWSMAVLDNTRAITTSANTSFVRCAFLLASLDEARILDKDNRVVWAAFNPELANNETKVIVQSLISDYDKIGDVPEFYREYIRQKAATIYGRDVLYGQNGDSFIFLTDYHIPDINASAVTNFRHSPALVKYIQKNTNTRLFIFGGDTVCSPSSADRENRMQLFLSDFKDTNMFPMMGNHEWRNAYMGNAPERNKRDFGSFLKPLKGITFNRTTKMPYYYFDNEETKVRYFMLYAVENDDIRSINFVSEQLAFLETHFRELDNTWKVVVCQHIVFISAEFDDDDNIIDAEFGGLGNNIKTKLDELSEINNAPKILCVISGHTHFDWLEFSNKGYPLISTCADATYDKHDIPYPNNDTRLKDTTSEQAFDVVHFNFVDNYMYMERVGWGKNRLADLTPKNLQLGQTLTIISKLSGTLNWWSSDTAILTVNNGVVTPVSTGNAFVRVADTNDNYEYININVQ